MSNQTIEQIPVELLQYLAERGNSTIAQNNYSHILNCFTEYCNQRNNGYHSQECIERCIAEHYALKAECFETLQSRDNKYHSKLRRICKMLEDINNSITPASRYCGKNSKKALQSESVPSEAYAQLSYHYER